MKKWIIAIVVLAVVGAAAWWGYGQYTAQQEAEQAATQSCRVRRRTRECDLGVGQAGAADLGRAEPGQSGAGDGHPCGRRRSGCRPGTCSSNWTQASCRARSKLRRPRWPKPPLRWTSCWRAPPTLRSRQPKQPSPQPRRALPRLPVRCWRPRRPSTRPKPRLSVHNASTANWPAIPPTLSARWPGRRWRWPKPASNRPRPPTIWSRAIRRSARCPNRGVSTRRRPRQRSPARHWR